MPSVTSALRHSVNSVLARIVVGALTKAASNRVEPVIHPGGPVVSLTSYGRRVKTVHLAIESIGQGSLKPGELILWIDEEEVLRNLPRPLALLQKRGLTIRKCINYGPHKKYYPYVASKMNFELPLVTADDDIFYPKHWLAGLVAAHEENTSDVVCYKAHVLSLNGSAIAPYSEWSPCQSTDASFLNFATGVCGVLYPASMMNYLKAAGTAFMDCCPKADDIWLHVAALRSNHRIRQIGNTPAYFRPIPATQRDGLMLTNMGHGNDVQIASTYTPADVELLGRSPELIPTIQALQEAR